MSATERFLPRDATQSAVMPQYVVCLPVRLSFRPSVTFRYRDHMGWNTSKIISRLIGLRFMLWLTPTWAIWSNENTPKIRVEYGWGMPHHYSTLSTKTCNISQTVQDRTKVTMTD